MLSSRRSFLIVLVTGAMMSLAACSPDGNVQAADGANAAADGANAAADVVAKPVDPVVRPTCSAEWLSCGLQKSVVSDGVHPFINENMGMSAVFPAGSRVCLTRSGDAPRGFYAFYGKPQLGCPEGAFGSPASMSINSMFNATFQRSIEEGMSRECLPLHGRVAELLRGQSLDITGHRSVACQSDLVGGGFEIVIHTMGGTQSDDAGQEVPIARYWIRFETQADRLEPDLAMFQAFVRALRIGVFE